MRMITCAYAVCLAMLSSAAAADPDRESAQRNCHDEAVSTGLQQESDIAAYIELCMQAWQTPAGYDEATPPSAEASPELQQGDAAETTAQ